MPRYRLRTLLILMAIAPPLMAGVWPLARSWLLQREHEKLHQFRKPQSAILIELYDPQTGTTNWEDVIANNRPNQ